MLIHSLVSKSTSLKQSHRVDFDTQHTPNIQDGLSTASNVHDSVWCKSNAHNMVVRLVTRPLIPNAVLNDTSMRAHVHLSTCGNIVTWNEPIE
jgi:hypothetical protein